VRRGGNLSVFLPRSIWCRCGASRAHPDVHTDYRAIRDWLLKEGVLSQENASPQGKGQSTPAQRYTVHFEFSEGSAVEDLHDHFDVDAVRRDVSKTTQARKKARAERQMNSRRALGRGRSNSRDAR
jgi:hypothetical protein